MKAMTCKQLGGACDQVFRANTFEEIAELSKNHGMEMYENGNEEHINAMKEMSLLMHNPDDMRKWYESKKNEFEMLPEE